MLLFSGVLILSSQILSLVLSVLTFVVKKMQTVVYLVVYSPCFNSVSLKVLLLLAILTCLDAATLPYKEYSHNSPLVSLPDKHPPNVYLCKGKEKRLETVTSEK